MRHYGSYEGHNVILLGYNDARGKLLILNPARLSNADREFLSDIVNGGYAQDRYDLYPALHRENHPNGGNAWLHFCKFGVEIPVHHVTIFDETQAVKWMGTNAYYAPEGAQRGGLPAREAAVKDGDAITEEMPVRQGQQLNNAPANFRTKDGDIPAWQDPKFLAQSGQQIPQGTAQPADYSGQADMNAALLEAIGGLTDAIKGMEKKMGSIDKAMRTSNQVLKKLETDAK